MGITIGCKIELVSLDDIARNVQNKKVYVSKVYDVLETNLLQIAMPIYDGKMIPLSVGSSYSACFFTDKGLYECNISVSSRYKSGNLFFLEVILLTQLKKVQRREFFRLDCSINSKIRIMTDEEYETGVYDESTSWEDAKIVDISGGGVKLIKQNYIEPNEMIILQFDLPIEGKVIPMELVGRILRSIPFQGRTDIYDERIEFINITKEKRDIIVKYIFECQRMMRAKESGLS